MELTGKELRQMHLARLGKVMFNLSILALLITLGGAMGFLFIGLYYVAITMLVLITLFTILFVKPDIYHSAEVAWNWWRSAFSQTTWYVVPITIALCVITIILLKKDTRENHKGRIAGEVAMIVVAVIALIIKIVQTVGGN